MSRAIDYLSYATIIMNTVFDISNLTKIMLNYQILLFTADFVAISA